MKHKGNLNMCRGEDTPTYHKTMSKTDLSLKFIKRQSGSIIKYFNEVEQCGGT